jgi:DNA polymerase elongation subunit (family B)
MINNFLAWLAEEDPDFLAVHDVYSNSLDLLVSRAVKKNIRNVSLLARLAPLYQLKPDSLRRKESATRGRLVVDTFLFAKEQYRLKDYSLGCLSERLSERLPALEADQLRALL